MFDQNQKEHPSDPSVPAPEVANPRDGTAHQSSSSGEDEEGEVSVNEIKGWESISFIKEGDVTEDSTDKANSNAAK